MLLRYFLHNFETVPVARYYWYHFCFYIPHALYFCREVFIFYCFLGFFKIIFLSPEMATSINIHFSFIITDSDVQFIVRDGSVNLHLLLLLMPQVLLLLLLLIILRLLLLM